MLWHRYEEVVDFCTECEMLVLANEDCPTAGVQSGSGQTGVFTPDPCLCQPTASSREDGGWPTFLVPTENFIMKLFTTYLYGRSVKVGMPKYDISCTSIMPPISNSCFLIQSSSLHAR